jgi:hypothetical protein
MALFSLSSSPARNFLLEGVIVGFQNFAWGSKLHKNKIWGNKNWGGNPLGSKNEKCLESTEMARKFKDS